MSWFPARAALFLAVLSPSLPAAGPALRPAVIDAGGYLLAYTPEPGWQVQSNPRSGVVVLQLIEREAGRVAHLAEYRVVKISVPADQRSLPLEEVAKLLCAGEASYAARSVFPAPLDRALRRGDSLRIGSRQLAVYAYPASRPGQAALPLTVAWVYVWLPESFKRDGGLYLISGFVYLNTGSDVMQAQVGQELRNLDDVVAAIKPR